MAFLRAKNIHLSYPLIDKVKRSQKGQNGGASEVGAQLNDRRQKSLEVVKNVSFDLKDGDRLAIVGPNGAGKSSLLNILAGIYEPTKGTLESEGTVSAVFNIGLGMRREATGYRNIEIRCLMAGLKKSEIQRVTHDVENFSGLGEFLHLPVKVYSRGMALRLNFALVTAMRADIVLMDEWIGAGDKEFRAKVIERMQDFVGSASIVVLTSHNTKLLQRVCNYALWIERGNVIKYGDAQTIIDEYHEHKSNKAEV